MRKLVFLVCTLTVALQVAGKDDPKYPVSAIPAKLRENVDVVLREDQSVYKITARNKASQYVFQAVTILNANGKRYAREAVGYDRLSKVSYFKGAVYNADGELIKRLKSSEIFDRGMYDGYTLFSDARMKTADLSQGEYPYTVEIEYEVELRYLFQIPDFYVQGGEKVSVENSRYELIFPEELRPRINARNISEKPVKSKTNDGLESVVYSFHNVMPLKREPLGPPVQELVQIIEAAPLKFEYDGYAGSMESWDEFGQWIATLNKGRDELPEATKAKIRSLTANLKTNEEKIKVVYEYMQNRTRYVSIQLGIGGFQPFNASVVDEKGYGDCKALSNYAVAMLKEAGVDANYTLIYAGEGAPQMDTSFPSSQFNHAVVSVPNGKDTLWLECTSQTNPFGYMGTFTGDRKALAITDKGAKVVRTPIYPAETNLQSRTANVYLEPTGDAKAKVQTTYSGLQYENDNLNFILSDQFDDQRKWIQRNTQIPVFDINSFTIKNVKNKIPSAIVDLDLTLKRLASVSGKRIFITPNLMNRSTFMPEKVENRKTKVVLTSAFVDLDTVHYHLPEGIYPEFLPEPVHIKSRFGEYEARYQVDEKGLTYVRRFKRVKGEFPAESYTELTEFYKNVNKADASKLVFVNKT